MYKIFHHDIFQTIANNNFCHRVILTHEMGLFVVDLYQRQMRSGCVEEFR